MKQTLNRPLVRKLGTPKTVRQLRKLLKGYSGKLVFGFRNQPMQSLYAVTYPNKTFILFQ